MIPKVRAIEVQVAIITAKYRVKSATTNLLIWAGKVNTISTLLK